MMSGGEIVQPTWSLQSSNAHLTCSALSGRINVAKPQAGLNGVIARGIQLDGHALAVSRATDYQWPLRLAESYVRGDDLVATYEATLDWPYAPQIYWRAADATINAAPFGSLSLLVSVQTHLLDTCPRIAVSTQLPAEELVQVGGGCILWRLPDGAMSYAEMMLPSDYCALKFESNVDGQQRVNWELFAEFLEKGVIRKARLKAVLLPRENDVGLATACYAALAEQPLPLTT